MTTILPNRGSRWVPGCKKVGFVNESSARGELAIIGARRNDPARQEGRFYTCQNCGLIHLTKKPRRALRRDGVHRGA